MARPSAIPTGIERLMSPGKVIVSRTDLRGVILDGNHAFTEYSGYAKSELIGAPHSIIRHPDMPRALFKLMWTEIQAQREIFLFVKNLAKDGSHYWAIAQVMPEIASGKTVGYLSFRRCPSRRGVDLFDSLYQKILAEERRLGGDAGMEAGLQMLTDALNAMGDTYQALIYGVPPE